jgi:hypothetical protein
VPPFVNQCQQPDSSLENQNSKSKSKDSVSSGSISAEYIEQIEEKNEDLEESKRNVNLCSKKVKWGKRYSSSADEGSVDSHGKECKNVVRDIKRR